MNDERNPGINPQSKSAKDYKLLNDQLSSVSRDDAFKARLKRQALLRYTNAFMTQYNRKNPHRKINKDEARKMLLEAASTQPTPAPLETKAADQELYRLNAYEILCSAGKCGETGEQSFNALSAQEKEDGKIYFRRGKDSHEEGRYIARETMNLHPKGPNETYYLTTGENGDNSNLIKGFLEEMLANGHHSLVESKQFSSKFKNYLGYPQLTDEENDHKLIITANNFESWCNKGSIGELILLNAAQKHLNTNNITDQTLTEYINGLDGDNITQLFENTEDPDFSANKDKIEKKFNTIKSRLVNKAINIEGTKGLKRICNNINENFENHYKKIYDLLQQDTQRSEGIELDLSTNPPRAYTTDILEDTTRTSDSGIAGFFKKIPSATSRVFSRQKQRSAAFRKLIAEELIQEIKDLNAQQPPANNTKIINCIYQLALLTNKDVRDIGKAFNITNQNIMQNLKNFKPSSELQAIKLIKELHTEILKGVNETTDFDASIEQMKASFQGIKVTIDMQTEPITITKTNEAPGNANNKYCTVGVAKELIKAIKQAPTDDQKQEYIKLLRLISDISDISENDLTQLLNQGNDQKQITP